MKLIIFMAIATALSANADEIDNELQSLQNEIQTNQKQQMTVKLKPARKPKPLYKDITAQNEEKFIAPSEPVQNQVIVTTPNETFNEIPRESIVADPEIKISRKKGLPFFFRMTLLPYAAYTSVDGSDSKAAQTGVQNQYNWALGGLATFDINLFGSRYIVLETGYQYHRVGIQMRSVPFSTLFPSYAGLAATDQILELGYMGMPIFAKWMIMGENKSSLYIKAGAAPSLLTFRKYRQLSSVPLDQDLYGGNNDYDILIQSGIGLSLKMFSALYVNFEGGGYQGVIPVTRRYEIYNAGFYGGLGLSYLF